jgi:hypothetical protein
VPSARSHPSRLTANTDSLPIDPSHHYSISVLKLNNGHWCVFFCC